MKEYLKLLLMNMNINQGKLILEPEDAQELIDFLVLISEKLKLEDAS